jgi:hypothetical protein
LTILKRGDLIALHRQRLQCRRIQRRERRGAVAGHLLKRLLIQALHERLARRG